MENGWTICESSNPNHLWLKERGNDYGDWLAIGSKTSKDLIATAYWAYDATLMARMAQVLNRPEDERNIPRSLRSDPRCLSNDAYVKPDGTVGTGSQTSDVLALHMNLLAGGQRAAVVDKLVEDIKAHDWHLTTGFLGTPYLLLELSKAGTVTSPIACCLQTTYPSWGYMIARGATTMWERWNGDQMMGDPSMNSYNHYAYGAVAEWLYRYVAGIDEDAEEPGFHRIVLHPQFDASLGEASATYDSPYGAITSDWKMTGNTTQLEGRHSGQHDGGDLSPGQHGHQDSRGSGRTSGRVAGFRCLSRKMATRSMQPEPASISSPCNVRTEFGNKILSLRRYTQGAPSLRV